MERHARFTPNSRHPRGDRHVRLADILSFTRSPRRRGRSASAAASQPSAAAVFRLIIRSNCVGCSTGRSPGFAPRSILSTFSGGTPEQCREIGALGHHAAALGGGTNTVHSWQLSSDRRRIDDLAIAVEERVGANIQRVRTVLEACYRRRNVLDAVDIAANGFDLDVARGAFHFAGLLVRGGIVLIDQDRDAPQPRDRLATGQAAW